MKNVVLRYRDYQIPLPQSFDDLDRLAADVPSVLWERGEWRRVVRLAEGVVIKFGDCDHGEEILAMQFARQQGLPVPEVLAFPGNAHRIWEPLTMERLLDWNLMDGVWYMCMTEMKGVSLDKVVDDLSQEALRTIATDLRTVLDVMRAVRSQFAASVSSQPLTTLTLPRLAQPQQLLSFSGFRAHLDNLLVACETTPEWRDELLQYIPSEGEIVFTHGDLVPKNILVDPESDYHVSAILDWENSGFCPEYWEYCRMHDPMFMTPGWKTVLKLIFSGDERDEQVQAVRGIMDYVTLRL